MPDTSLVSASPQQIITRLRNVITQLDRLPIPTGATGGLLLDALELTNRIRDRIRERAKAALLEEPDLIEGWHLETAQMRRLSKDARKVWRALKKLEPSLSLEEFCSACVPSLGAIFELMEPLFPSMTEAKREVEDVLGELISLEAVNRLIKDKEGK